MTLPGEQFARLQAAVVEAFSRDELRRLLKVDLDVNLEAITPDKGFAAQVFDLLLWLERRGRLLEFAGRARAANPAYEQLAAACAAVQELAAPHAADVGAPPDLAAANDLASMLGIEWVRVPGGVLRMGSDAGTDRWAQANELPQHEVAMPPCLVARYPITNDQYQVFVMAAEHPPPPHWRDGAFPKGKHAHPVVNVSWHDAEAFCRWANVQLPSEAQWEWAARSPDQRLWPWGDVPPSPLHCNYALKMGSTTPVGLFPAGATALGIYDMAGNVWEWTSSLGLPYPFDAAGGREAARGGLRVVRGGAYDSPARAVRCASRSAINPAYGYDDVGLRVVLYNPAASTPTGK